MKLFAALNIVRLAARTGIVLGVVSVLIGQAMAADELADQQHEEMSPAEHTANLRTFRARQMEERLGTESEKLQQHCRYESDIATAPPQKWVALTFDDGPSSTQTEIILVQLAKYGIKASFFNIGMHAAAHPELVQKVLDAGHELIGGHSWKHPNFHDIDAARQDQEIRRTDQLLAPAMAATGKKFFRYPYGNATCTSNALLHELEYAIVGWHVDSCDWAFAATGEVGPKDAQICEVHADNRGNYVGHVLDAIKLRQGGIVLMHEIHPQTVAQLPAVIERLQAEGYQFTTVSDPLFASSLR